MSYMVVWGKEGRLQQLVGSKLDEFFHQQTNFFKENYLQLSHFSPKCHPQNKKAL